MSFTDWTPQQALEALQADGDRTWRVLDVRTEPEHRSHRIDGATLIPVQVLAERSEELDPQQPYLVFCEHGVRSIAACEILGSQGFRQLVNVSGGMARWVAEGLPHVRG